MSDEEDTPICGDCKHIVYVGGAQKYQCMKKQVILKDKVVEERIPVECEDFDPAPRVMRIKMQEYVEVGITTVYGGGSIQIPAQIRVDLGIKDGDKLLWIRKGRRDYGFRKVGLKPPFTPQYR